MPQAHEPAQIKMPVEWRMKSSMRRKEFIDLILDSISDYFDA